MFFCKARRFFKHAENSLEKKLNVGFKRNLARIFHPKAVFSLQHIFYVLFVGIAFADNFVKIYKFDRAEIGNSGANLKNKLFVAFISGRIL